MGAASGFSYEIRKNGEVVISHEGRLAETLRGRAADRFLAQVGRGDDQLLMARLTGNFKRGNERRSSR